MENREREWLLDGIEKILIPEFEQRGFMKWPLDIEDSHSPSIFQAFPFGRLRRSTPAGTEQVEVQLGRDALPVFRLNIGFIPFGGIAHRLGQVANEGAWVHYLDSYYVAYQHPMFRTWFGLCHWPGRTINESDVNALVSEVVTIIPEIEQVFKGNGRGRHIRRV